MTSFNHDMPPRQPDKNEPIDHPARDVLDFIDETVAQITDAEVDDHLRKVADQTGYRQRHGQVMRPARPAGDIRQANTRRRPVSRILLALAGAEPAVADQVPTERVKLESLGYAILITSAMAVVSMWFALTSAIGVNGIVGIPAALIWGFVIMGIDRWLVASMPIGPTRRKLAFAAPRILLAALLGIVIATPLVLRIFQPEINTQIAVIKQQQASQFLAEQQRSHLGRQLSYLQAQVVALERVIDSGGQVSVNPTSDRQLQDLTKQRTLAIAQEQKYYQEWQCQLYGGQGCPAKGNGALAQASHKSYEQAAARVRGLNDQIQNREANLTATGTAAAAYRLRQARAALPAAQQQLTAAQVHWNAMQDSFSRITNADNGLLIRLEALGQLAGHDNTLNTARILLFLLFLLIECLPVVVKLLQQPGAYEMILAREVDRRLKIALIQEALQRQVLTAMQEEHLPQVPRPRGTKPTQASSCTEPLTVPDSLRREIESIYPFMKDTSETTAPAYTNELENCFLAISQAVNDLLRHGYDNDQIIEALRITTRMATQQLAAAYQVAIEKIPSS